MDVAVGFPHYPGIQPSEGQRQCYDLGKLCFKRTGERGFGGGSCEEERNMFREEEDM